MKQEMDMTRGAILPKALRFALPLLLTCIMQQLYSMVDAVIIKRLAGLDAFAAIGATGSLLWIVESMLMGLAHGFGVVFAQVAGSVKERENIGSVARRAALIALGLAVAACAVLLLLGDALLLAMQTPARIMGQASAYLKSMTLFLCMAALFNIVGSLLRANGDSGTPFRAMLVSTFVNIALDYVLIRFAGMGAAGAGIATGLSQGLAVALCMGECLKLKFGREPKGTTKRLLRMGLPSLLRDGVISCGGGIVQSVVNSFGVHVIAGVAASKKYFTVLQMCGSAIEGTAATFAGQNTGAGKMDRVRKGMRLMIGLALGASIVTAGLTFAFADGMIALLLGGAEAAEALASGAKALRWAAAFLPALYLLCVVRAALQNMGYAGISMVSGFMELAGRIASAAFLPALIGETSAYVAEEIGWAIAMAYLLVSYFVKIRALSTAKRK
ncbi:MAG: MATE family efflux transporter [Clostridia bacterium]|nr:MATE family efflux transporter [Clostridia bacterium]MBQ4085415.1 MATE family efflux transporter [Clostridia bacterium]